MSPSETDRNGGELLSPAQHSTSGDLRASNLYFPTLSSSLLSMYYRLRVFLAGNDAGPHFRRLKTIQLGSSAPERGATGPHDPAFGGVFHA